MTEEELRVLDVEVALTVFDRHWFHLTHRPNGDSSASFDLVRIMTEDESARYPWAGWSIEAMTDEDGMMLFCDEAFASRRQNAMYTGPEYSTDRDAAWDVEEEIQRRGLYAEYGEAMSILLDSPFVSASYYDFLHASPELRCRAALAAVRGAKETP